MVMTLTPNITHTTAGSFAREYHGDRGSVSLRKHAGGKMNASAVAETPPVISSMTPRSHVMSAKNIDENKMVVVKNMCRCGLNASCGKKKLLNDLSAYKQF